MELASSCELFNLFQRGLFFILQKSQLPTPPLLCKYLSNCDRNRRSPNHIQQ